MRKQNSPQRTTIQRSFDFVSKHSLSEKSAPLAGKSRRIRMRCMFVIAVLWVGVLGSRLYALQISNFDKWHDWALKQHFTEVELASERGPIVDRDEKLLAVSVPAGSVYVRTKQLKNKDKEKISATLASYLAMNKKEVFSKLNEAKPFVWIKRQVPRQTAERIAELDIAGINFVLEPKRFYPYNNAASTLIGKVGIDGDGLSGLEKVYEKELHEQNRKTRMVRDAYGNLIQLASTSSEKFELPKGSVLRVTLDTAIQQIMDEETDLGQKKANSKSVMAILVDSDRGDILAMSQSNSANFNLTHATSSKDLKNLLVEAVFEPGSIFKPIVAAAAIEEGVLKPTDLINCENGRFYFMKHTIKDVHPSGVIPLSDVVIRSSNIGMTKVGMKLGKERLYNYIRRFGFGSKTELNLPGETDGILRPVSKWSGVDVATHSFGQGVAVTPLQMVRAISAIANGGVLPELHVVMDGKQRPGTRIISRSTAASVREMMYGVVEDEHGTGKNAYIEGIRVGGKTGTAQKAKADGRGYQAGAYVSSFIGFADGQDVGLKRKLTLAVIVDEAHAGSIYGGTLAAPVFRRIMQRTLHLLVTRSEITPEEPSFPRGDSIIQANRSPQMTNVKYDG